MNRRRLIASSFALAGAGAAGKALADIPARSLSLLNLHTGEKLSATYWEGGAYVSDALQALNHLLRDFRTGESHTMAPQLLDLVNLLGRKLETRQTVQIISGYRSPQTNAALHERSSGVATRSLHMQGQAMDIRIPGVELSRVRDAALDMKLGGVGYYPGSDFVHVDIGRVRRW
ncbi:MAG TPA: DUF882 domain-containing protein [Phenylobacterium sp.]|nr:DUF882 domain-containing protein [Phenylobacterium sp.]